MDFRGEAKGDGRWFFVVGGCWWIRTCAVRELDWPDPRLVKGSDDVYLGEAIRQRGWDIADLEAPRGDRPECAARGHGAPRPRLRGLVAEPVAVSVGRGGGD